MSMKYADVVSAFPFTGAVTCDQCFNGTRSRIWCPNGKVIGTNLNDGSSVTFQVKICWEAKTGLALHESTRSFIAASDGETPIRVQAQCQFVDLQGACGVYTGRILIGMMCFLFALICTGIVAWYFRRRWSKAKQLESQQIEVEGIGVQGALRSSASTDQLLGPRPSQDEQEEGHAGNTRTAGGGGGGGGGGPKGASLGTAFWPIKGPQALRKTGKPGAQVAGRAAITDPNRMKTGGQLRPIGRSDSANSFDALNDSSFDEVEMKPIRTTARETSTHDPSRRRSSRAQ